MYRRGDRATRGWASCGGQLEARPLVVVIALRLVLWFNSALTYALALSGIRTRDYLLGSAIALAPVVAIATLLSGWLGG
jgi:uncharacterized membrane protein YdjX (TVP38/TMEM64 family)